MAYYRCHDCNRKFHSFSNASNHFCWCLKEILESQDINFYCYTEKLTTPKKPEIEKRLEFVPINLTPKKRELETQS